MKAEFWRKRWQNNQIAFHEKDGNALLAAHVGALGLGADARIFLPFCGKTGDIPWLLGHGYRVAGAELVEDAVVQLFKDLGVTPEIERTGQLSRYSAERMDIFVGDFFDLSAASLGPVDAVYDRAALVALPADMRPRYAAHLATVTGRAPQLLISFEYDQAALDGPPFSVTGDEIARHYAVTHALKALDSVSIPGGLKKKAPAQETVWLLSPR